MVLVNRLASHRGHGNRAVCNLSDSVHHLDIALPEQQHRRKQHPVCRDLVRELCQLVPRHRSSVRDLVLQHRLHRFGYLNRFGLHLGSCGLCVLASALSRSSRWFAEPHLDSDVPIASWFGCYLRHVDRNRKDLSGVWSRQPAGPNHDLHGRLTWWWNLPNVWILQHRS